MKINTQVRLIQPVVEGTVIDVQWDKEAGELVALVRGTFGERWFKVSELEEKGDE